MVYTFSHFILKNQIHSSFPAYLSGQKHLSMDKDKGGKTDITIKLYTKPIISPHTPPGLFPFLRPGQTRPEAVSSSG
jgi:hypothetical protein